MRMGLKIVSILAAGAAIWLLIAHQTGRFSQKVKAIETPLQHTAETAPSKSVLVKAINVPRVEEAVGSVQSRHRVDISPQIQASILEIPVNAGDRVEAGDLLVRLDPRDLQAKVGQAEQALTAAMANLRQANSDYVRTRELLERKVASIQEGENARLRLEVTSATLGEATRALEIAKVALSHADMKSPVAGVVIDKRQNAGDMAIPGRPMLSIYDPSILRLEAPIRETLATQLHVGQNVRVRIGANRELTTGTVDEIVPQAEVASRTFLVKVLLPPATNLFAGMYGRVLIDTGMDRIHVIPAAAVKRIGQLEFVIVEDSNGAPDRRFIQTGRTFGADLEVLAGLTEGERVRIPQ